MSLLEVNKITPQSGTTLTLGDTGDTINFGSGVLPNFENLTVTGDLTVDTNSLKVDSTNNRVGIGTASPTVALDVVGAITATGNITGTLATASQPNITSVGTLSSATVSGDLTVDTDTLRVFNSGDYVQIGDGSNRTNFLSNSSDSLQIKNGIIFESGDAAVNNEIFTYRSNSLIFGTSASERMRIDSAGRVGIATSSPGSFNAQAYNLVVGSGSGDAGMTIYSGSTSGDSGNIFFADGTTGSDPVRGGITYDHGTNQLKFRVNDANRMEIDSSGNVGIKNSSPSHTLDISDTTTTSKTLRVGQSSGTSAADATMIISNGGTGDAMLRFDYEGSNTDRARIGVTSSGQTLKFFTAGNNERMQINNSGLVGIGTSSPDAELHVGDGGSSSDNTRIRILGGNAGYSTIQLGDSDSANRGQIQYDHTNDKLDFRVNAGTRAAIDSSGNVVIGSDTVDTSGSGYANIYGQTTATTTNKTALGIVGATSGASAGGAAELLGSININCESDSSTNATGFMQFYTGSGGGLSERMRINSSGQVIVGGTSAENSSVIFEAKGATNPIIQVEDTTNNVRCGIQAGDSSAVIRAPQNYPLVFVVGNSEPEHMRINNSGDIYIGGTTQNAEGALTIRPNETFGSVLLQLNRPSSTNTSQGVIFYNGGTDVGSIDYDHSGVAYTSTSDYRVKENVVDITGATERLKQLQPKRFNFISDANKTIDGFLAHEVSDIVPEAVRGTKDEVDGEGNPKYQGIDQSKLVPLLVATIKELEARIEALENA